jgi:hypothetical protein
MAETESRTRDTTPEQNIDPEQAWFWSDEWQSGEHEAEVDARNQHGILHENGQAFLNALRERTYTVED